MTPAPCSSKSAANASRNATLSLLRAPFARPPVFFFQFQIGSFCLPLIVDNRQRSVVDRIVRGSTHSRPAWFGAGSLMRHKEQLRPVRWFPSLNLQNKKGADGKARGPTPSKHIMETVRPMVEERTVMSAFGGKADIGLTPRNVRY